MNTIIERWQGAKVLERLITRAHDKGFKDGFEKGRAQAWVDNYLENAAKDKARRNPLGQFKEKP